MTTSISCRSDLTSDHNKGSANIKSDVVSTESSGSSTDVTVTTLVGGPVLSLINKRLRNQCKKFNRILHMEELLAQGKPLNKDQAQLLRSKPAIFALIDELEKLRNLLASTVSEEISLALQCHAISGKNDTSQDQDQDQEKASEEKESKAHKELPIDSRSGHKEESTKIKSDVLVSVVSQRFSSDVADTTLVGGPVLSLINKHLQNHHEKLNQILQVEEFLAQGKPLSTEQAQLLQSKSAVSAFIDELEKLRKPLASAVSEEISLALQCHAISGKSGTCQDQDQEKASEEKESKSCKELPIDPKSDHDGSTKDVMSTECSGPSQVDQQNEGNALPSRTGLKQKDRKWKIWCKNYLEENSRLLCDKMMLELEFESLKLSYVVYQLHASLIHHWPTFNGDSYMDLKEEDLEEENSLVDQQNEEFSLSPWEAERLGISINDNMEEVDWKKWCWILRGSNMWLMEMLKVYQDELDVMKKVIREFPDLVGGKPADTSELWNLS